MITGIFAGAAEIWTHLHWQTKALMGAVIALVIAYFIVTHRAYERGATGAIQAIERANDASQKRADDASDPVDRCYADGGRWLRDSGSCQPAVRRDR